MQKPKLFFIKRILRVITSTLLLILVACQSSTPVQKEPSLDSNIQNILVKTTKPVEVKIKEEEFPLPNCGGTAELHQTLGTQVSISKSVTIGAKATLRGGGEVDIPETVRLKLEIEIEASYQQTVEAARSRLDTIDMPAAAGTHVVYILGWYEQIYESLVQYSDNGKVYEVPYSYKISLPKIESSYQVPCNTLQESTSPIVVANEGMIKTKRPTSEELSRLDNLWSLTSFRDPKSPMTLYYPVAIKHEETYFINFGQCATTPKQLIVILEPFRLQFFINDSPISDEDILEYDITTKDGWSCIYWATILSEWMANSIVKLEIVFSYSEEIYDGKNFYEPGEYRHVFNITVR